MIEFECPACEATIRVGENAVGKKGRCPKCQTLLLVPDPDDFDEDEEDEETEPETESESPAPVDTAAQSDTEPEPDFTPPPEPEPVPEPAPEPLTEPAPASAVAAAADNAAPDDAEASPPTSEVIDQSPDGSVSIDPAPVDPDNPFAFAAPPSPLARVTSSRRSRRRGGSRSSSRATTSIMAAMAGVFVLLVGGGVLYLLMQPDLSGSLEGERFRTVELPAVSFARPADDVPSDSVTAVTDVLRNQGLPLKSEYISVMIDAVGDQPRVTVTPGPQATAVRVALGDQPGVKTVLVRERERITKVKQRELRTATSGLYRDYAAYLNDGTSMSKLPEYRNQVALNAAVGPVGYAVEAVVSGYPFPCVYEDAEGHCYYFLPDGIRTFRLRGRKLPDGSTPLPVDYEVTLVDAASPVVSRSQPDETDAEPATDETPTDEISEEEEEKPPTENESDSPTDEEMPDESAEESA